MGVTKQWRPKCHLNLVGESNVFPTQSYALLQFIVEYLVFLHVFWLSGSDIGISQEKWPKIKTDVDQINVLYTLSLYNVLCQSDLSKVKKKK